VQVLDFLPGADNLNPQYGPDNRIYFLSNADGRRNLFEYDPATSQVSRLTNYFTGITGITAFSPALTVSAQTGQVVYNYLRHQRYSLFRAHTADFVRQPWAAGRVNLAAATLPPGSKLANDQVGRQLRENRRLALADSTEFQSRPYAPKFELSYIGGSAGGGVSTGPMGPGIAGGVTTLFTDILNHHQVLGALSINGEIYDFAGQAAYLNQKSKLQWGLGLSHIPYLSGGQFYAPDTLQLKEGAIEVLNEGLLLQRTFEDQVSVFSYLPLSQTRRLEVSASFARYHQRRDVINTYYDANCIQVGQDRKKLATPPGFSLGQANLAFVSDNSTSGVTSPLSGHRYRFDVGQTLGAIQFNTLLADYRKYWFSRPVGFALRALHYGRYGGDAERMYPLYLGNELFVRGYNNGLYQYNQCPDGTCLGINQLVGSRLAVANAEIRLPFSGPERLSLIKSGYLFSDLVLFADGGLAWSRKDPVRFDWRPKTADVHIPVYSAGASWRINLFGYLIVEPYVALPLQATQARPTFGFFLSGGGF
jgi:hypothetical protein